MFDTGHIIDSERIFRGGGLLFLKQFKYKLEVTNPVDVYKRQAHFRALWISTVSSLDWPKTTAVDEASRLAQQKELTDLLDRACELNMNAVIFQVRSQSDALYPSQFAPWGACLTGTLGGDPGYDPLQFAIEQAHLRNLEFHAWFNPYRVSTSLSDSTVNALKAAEKSVFNTHPEWVKTSASRYVLDPGIPAARQLVEECVLEAVQNYDIDAVHLSLIHI